MTFGQQVLHVARKDLRQSAGLIGTYLVLVLFATVQALRNQSANGTSFDIIPLLVILTGILVAASVVQNDSPTRSVAFWASRPLDPRAVLGAKSVEAVMVAIVAIGAQSICLLRYGLPMAKQLSLLGGSLVSFPLFLLMAMVGAALTRDLRTFLIAVMGTFIVFTVTLQLLFLGHLTRVPWWIHGVTNAAGTVAAIALLFHVYTARDFSARIKFIGAGIVLLVFIGNNLPIVARYVTPHPGPDIAVSTATLEVTLLPRSGDAQGKPRLELTLVGANADERWRLIDGNATFALTNGETYRVPLESRTLQIGGGNALLAKGYRSLNGPQNQGWWRTQVAAEANTKEAPRSVGSIARIEIDAQVEIWQSELAGEMPLVPGAALESRGTHIHVARADRTADGIQLSLEGSSPPGGPRTEESFPPEFAESQFVLANDARREITSLSAGRGQSSGTLLVLPGIMMNSFSQELATPQRSRVQVSADWLDGAKLAVMRWNLRGTRMVHSTTRITKAPS